jgi:hypothetical protein
MSVRVAGATGTAATIVAGILLATLSLSAFGAARTLIGFLALFLLAATVPRANSRGK